MSHYTLVSYTLEGIGFFCNTETFRFKVIYNEPPIPEEYDDGLWDYGNYYTEIPHPVKDYDLGDIDEYEDEQIEEDINFFDIDEDNIPDELDDGLFNFIYDDEDAFNTAIGDNNFLNVVSDEDDDYETDIEDEKDYDFEVFSGVYLDGLDEETQADEKICEIIDRKLDRHKRLTKKKIEEAFKKIKEKKSLIKKFRKEAAEEAKEEK